MLCSVYISGVEASGALPSAAPLMSCHSVNTDKHTHNTIIFTVLVQGGSHWHFHGLKCKSTREGGHLVVTKGNTPLQPHLKEHAPHTCQIHEHDP